MKQKCTWMWFKHFKITTCTKEFQKFQNLGVICSDARLKKYDLWLTCNWFNQTIKSLSNVEFEIKKLDFEYVSNYIRNEEKINKKISVKKSMFIV
jgi:hypothetical protein